MDEEKKKVFFNNMIYPSTSHQPATPKAPCDEGTSSAGKKKTELEPGHELLLALLESTGNMQPEHEPEVPAAAFAFLFLVCVV